MTKWENDYLKVLFVAFLKKIRSFKYLFLILSSNFLVFQYKID